MFGIFELFPFPQMKGERYLLCWVPGQPKVKVTLGLTVSQPASQPASISRCRAHSGACDQILLSVLRLLPESCSHVSVERPL
jgi:hypothetical protein